MIRSSTRRRGALLAVVVLLVLCGGLLQAVPRLLPPRQPAVPVEADPGRGDAPADGRPDRPGQAARADQAGPPPAGGQVAGRRSITLAFAGDVHFEGGVSALLERPDADLGPMRLALKDADVAVVNLESAVTSGGRRAEKELEDPARRYWFRSPPSVLGLLERSGVDAVSLANNHGADYGAAGLDETLRAATRSRVAVLGVGRDPVEAFRPYEVAVDGVRVAVLAADASPAESRDPVWDVGASGPGLAAARNPGRLLAAVRAAAAGNDVVAVYLHWGAEGERCPTAGQRTLARQLAGAGADIVVGSHAHELLGAGMLGDTYVGYGLGNFVWYHGRRAETGVLRLTVADGKVVRDDWLPALMPPSGGRPRPVTGSARLDAVQDWRALRGCTDLAPGPAEERLPVYASAVAPLPDAVRRRMTGSSHDPARCPVGLDDLRLVTLRHVGFDGRARTGQLVVHERHARDVAGVFAELYAARFPIRRMQLVDAHGGDDDRSMAADNSSAYNCRTVAGRSTLSEHAYGAAMDLNPLENPYVTRDGVLPPGGLGYSAVDRSRGARAAPGVIVADDVVVRAFARIGWEWGGEWAEADYQHFHAP